MIDDLRSAVAALLPLVRDGVHYNHPAVVVSGAGWSLTIVCPWRLSRAGALVCAFGDSEAEARLRVRSWASAEAR